MNIDYNIDKIQKISSEIYGSLELLEELKHLSNDELINNKHMVSSAKYNLIVAIEGMIDLCNHVISVNGWGAPVDYADAFAILCNKGAFDKDSLELYVKMTRFRNRLVHIYWEVDSNYLQEILHSHLDDIKKFLKQFNIFIGIV